jgi:hypothetical protein
VPNSKLVILLNICAKSKLTYFKCLNFAKPQPLWAIVFWDSLELTKKNKKKTLTKKLVSIGLVSVTLLSLIYTDPIWTRYLGGRWILLIGLLIVVGFVWLIIKLIKEAIGLIKNRKIFKAGNLLPTLLIVAVCLVLK